MNYGFIFISFFMLISIPIVLSLILPFFGLSLDTESLRETALELEIEFFPMIIFDIIDAITGVWVIGGAIERLYETFLFPFFYLLFYLPFLSMIIIPTFIGFLAVVVWKMLMIIKDVIPFT